MSNSEFEKPIKIKLNEIGGSSDNSNPEKPISPDDITVELVECILNNLNGDKFGSLMKTYSGEFQYITGFINFLKEELKVTIKSRECVTKLKEVMPQIGSFTYNGCTYTLEYKYVNGLKIRILNGDTLESADLTRSIGSIDLNTHTQTVLMIAGLTHVTSKDNCIMRVVDNWEIADRKTYTRAQFWSQWLKTEALVENPNDTHRKLSDLIEHLININYQIENLDYWIHDFTDQFNPKYSIKFENGSVTIFNKSRNPNSNNI